MADRTIPFNRLQGLPSAPVKYKMLDEAYPGSTLFTFSRQVNGWSSISPVIQRQDRFT